MTTNHTTFEKVVEAYARLENQQAVARELGLARTTVQYHLRKAAERGFIPRESWAPVVPEGYALKGVSTLVGEDGGVKAQWFKAHRHAEDYERLLEVLEARLSCETPYPALETASAVEGATTTLYPLSDHHYGMYAWAAEAGRNYDTKIAWKLLADAMSDLVSHAPASGTGIILNLGDFFHAENDLARTLKNGNPLDVDNRFAEVIGTGVDLTIHCIQLALQKHEQVVYRALAGNHDPYTSLALAVAIEKFFANNMRVTVDKDPSYFWTYEFGSNMLCASHGDMTKPQDMPGLMAARWPKVWGRTTYRYCHLGHVHHKSVGGGEKAGVVWETHQTLAPKDAWHSQMGYSSGRSMKAITYHADHGERSRITRNIDYQ